MFFDTPDAFRSSDRKRVTLFGMSGVGKTHVSRVLRAEDWFHYSVDYRIGAGYMKEAIEDNLKREAMASPLLKQLLLSDSIYISSNLTMDNLTPLSTYLGKPGDPSKGGLPFEDYIRRQRQHRAAEIAAMGDVERFINRAETLYDYRDFICDASGSLCEIIDPHNPADPVLTHVAEHTALLFIRGGPEHEQALIQRFSADPKPMYYAEADMRGYWADYQLEAHRREERHGEGRGGEPVIDASLVDPDSFMRWGFARALKRRAPIYMAIAANWGYETTPEEISAVRDAADFVDLVEAAVARRLA